LQPNSHPPLPLSKLFPHYLIAFCHANHPSFTQSQVKVDAKNAEGDVASQIVDRLVERTRLVLNAASNGHQPQQQQQQAVVVQAVAGSGKTTLLADYYKGAQDPNLSKLAIVYNKGAQQELQKRGVTGASTIHAFGRSLALAS
jgi:hypothetical protein